MNELARLGRLGRLGRLAPLAFVAVVALKSIGEPVRPDDLWWHLAMGRIIATTGAIPHADVLTFTRAGVPYFDQPWLAQVLLYAAHGSIGLGGLLDLDFVIVLFAFGLVACAALRRGASPAAIAAVALALTPLAARGWSLRPQTLAVPLFAAVAALLFARRTGGRARLLAVIPLLVALWANLHGSFPLGVVLVAAFLAAGLVERRRLDVPLAATLACCILSPLVNPRGAGIYGYVASLLASTPVHEIAPEWRQPWHAGVEGVAIGVTVAVALAILVRRRAWSDLAIVAPFALLEAAAVRNGIWLALVLVPVLAPIASSLPALAPSPAPPAREAPSPAPSARVPPHLLAAAVFAVLCLALPWVKPRLVPRPYGPLAWEVRTPVGAAAFLAAEPAATRPRRLLEDASAGCYLEWTLPSQPAFIDARLELFPVEQWHALFAGDRRLLDDYAIDGVILGKQAAHALVGADPRFELRYEDDAFAYYRATTSRVDARTPAR